MTALPYNLKSLKNIRDKSNRWIAERSELIAAKVERLMIACNGYNKIQPIRLSKSAATMRPSGAAGSLMHNSRNRSGLDFDLLSTQQPQFRPCLGSQRRTITPISVMNKCRSNTLLVFGIC